MLSRLNRRFTLSRGGVTWRGYRLHLHGLSFYRFDFNGLSIESRIVSGIGELWTIKCNGVSEWTKSQKKKKMKKDSRKSRVLIRSSICSHGRTTLCIFVFKAAGVVPFLHRTTPVSICIPSPTIIAISSAAFCKSSSLTFQWLLFLGVIKAWIQWRG